MDIGNMIGQGIQKAQNFFSVPNAYPNVKSPIPNQNQVVQTMPPGIQSPVPNSEITPHIQGPSAFESALDSFKQTLGGIPHGIQQDAGNAWNYAFGAPHVDQAVASQSAQARIPVQQVPQASMQPIKVATPTPTQAFPGEDAYVQHLTSQTGGDPNYYRSLYRQAVAGPGNTGNFYGGAQAPVTADNAFNDFTYKEVPGQLKNLIFNSAQQAGVDPSIFASILNTEHGFQTTGNSPKNTDGSYDRGIAQLNSSAHPDVTDEQANDPNFAVPYAARLLANYIKGTGGDINRGIAAYNVGVNGSSNPKSFIPGDPRTPGQRYIDKVSGGLSDKLLKKYNIRPSRK